MTYKVISTRLAGETIITTVEYNFDGTIVTTEIPHFMKKTLEEIDIDIINRSASELAKLQAEADNAALIALIPLNEEKPIE
jgi:hypothetical protein